MCVQNQSGPIFQFCTLSLVVYCLNLMSLGFYVIYTTQTAFVWLRPGLTLKFLNEIQGYNVIRSDRNRHGGGVIIYVNSCFTFNCLCIGPDELEFIILSVSHSNNRMVLGVL